MAILNSRFSASNSQHDQRARADVVYSKTSLEQKRLAPMSLCPLHPLDGTMIEVQFAVGKTLRTVQGRGKYESSDPDYGPVLKILVADPKGNFEFVLPESMWQGEPARSGIPGCDYRISLVPNPD